MTSPPRTCPGPDCGRTIKRGMFACKPCWFKIPKEIRNEIWATYRALQRDLSRPRVEAYREAERKGLEALGAEATV